MGGEEWSGVLSGDGVCGEGCGEGEVRDAEEWSGVVGCSEWCDKG